MIEMVILLLVFSSDTIEAQTWEQIDMHFPSGDTLLDNATISMATENTGWIISDGFVIQGMPPSQPMTRIFKTTDGGHNWFLQTAFESFLWISSVLAFDSIHCCVIGGPSGTGVMLSTSDGGAVWSRTDIVDLGGDYFKCLYFWDSKHGVAFNRHRWYTTDGGQSWWKGGDTLNVFPIPSDVSFVNGRSGWMVSAMTPYGTDAGYIAHSNDSGKT